MQKTGPISIGGVHDKDLPDILRRFKGEGIDVKLPFELVGEVEINADLAPRGKGNIEIPKEELKAYNITPLDVEKPKEKVKEKEVKVKPIEEDKPKEKESKPKKEHIKKDIKKVTKVKSPEKTKGKKE